MQEVGLAFGLGVEVEEFFDGGTQVAVAAALLVQERAALLGSRSAACWNSASTASGDGSGMLLPFSGQLSRFISHARM